MPAPPAITPSACANNFPTPLRRTRSRGLRHHSEDMSKRRRKNAGKGRTDGQSTLAANEVSAAEHDAQQPIQFCAVNNPDMNKSKEVTPNPEETAQSALAEPAPID